MSEKDLNTVETSLNTENQEATPSDSPASNSEAKLQKEIAEWKDKYLRIYAEFDTFRRRTAREMLEINKTAGKEVIVDLLPILDDFERAFKYNPNDENKGFELIFNKLKNILEQRGLKQMDSINTVFNPDFQSAIAEIPAPTPELSGKIVDEVERGYYLHDTIIRHAKVVVGK